MADREVADVLGKLLEHDVGSGIVRCEADVFGGARNAGLPGINTSWRSTRMAAAGSRSGRG